MTKQPPYSSLLVSLVTQCLRHGGMVLRCLWKALVQTIEHDGIEHAGYLSFVGMLGFFPFAVFLVALTGFAGDSELGAQFITLLLDTLPAELVAALQPRIDEILSGPPQGLLTIAIVGAIWTASSGVEGLRTILNRAYRVQTPPAYLLRRLMSIVQFLIMTGIIIIGMGFLVPIPLLWSFVAEPPSSSLPNP